VQTFASKKEMLAAAAEVLMPNYRLCVVLACIMLVLLAGPVLLWGQEYRATITGVVRDASKAVISNATVSVRNLDTNEVITVKTNDAGVYTVPFLHPGHKLEVSAEATGFKRLTYPPVVLSISQVQTADFVLQVGTPSEVVTVTTDAYQVGLDAATADRGLQVDNKTLTELPLNGRNAMSFLDTLSGITDENGAGMIPVATDMYYASQFTVNGTSQAGIEYLIDGQPNNASPWYNNGPSSIPTIDALQEMKVITNPYDAQLGHSASGVVSMEFKSGTNTIHGTAWEFGKRTYMDANSWFNNNNGIPRSTSNHKEDQYGFEVGGPLYIPHLYDGRNKTFFMFSWERFKSVLPQYPYFVTQDLPNPSWLQGDFTNFTDNAANCQANGNSVGCLIPVFDPLTRDSNGLAQIIHNSAGEYNKVDPSRFNPIAVNLLTSILTNPQMKPIVTIPNQYPWETVWADTISQNRVFNNFAARADQIIGGKDHLSFNLFRGNSNNVIYGSPADVPWRAGENFKEYHYNVGLDWVHTFSSNLLLDFHASYQRYWRSDGFPSNFDLASIGFDPGLAASLPYKGFPAITFSMQQPLVAGMFAPGRDFYYMPDDTYSYAPTLTWVHNKHTIRTGIDVRFFHVTYLANWTSSLGLDFSGNATSESYNNGNNYNDLQFAPDGTPLSSQAGNAILDFLLSQPDTASITDQKFPYFSTRYFAPWVQDDWKVTPKLTLNLGLRYDLNGPPTARHNWINTGFNLNAVNPIDPLVNRSVDPNLPTLMGGYVFATSGHNTSFNRDYTKIQPRIGFAYLLTPKTVVRGGYGRLVENPAIAGTISGVNAAGFSAFTPFVNSPDGGITFYADNLTNPFGQNGISVNSGVAPIPSSSLGLLTDVGGSAQFMNPDYKLPYVNSFSLGIQRALPKNGKLEVSYVGTRSNDQSWNLNTVDLNIPFYKSCDRTTASVSNPDPRQTCAQQLPNPFQGVPGVTGSLYTNATLSAQQLARPYPEFTGITERNLSTGHTWYNSMQTTFTQRISWVQVNASWTWSKNMGSVGYVDQQYMVPRRSIDGRDRKHRIAVQSVLDIPVGRGKTFFSGMNRPMDAVFGGWHLGTSYFWEGGLPVGLPSGWNLIGNIHGPKVSAPYTIDLGMNSCYVPFHGPGVDNIPYWHYGSPLDKNGNSCSDPAWQQTAYHSMVTEQSNSAAIRGPSNQQLDTNLAKTFKPTERIGIEVRMEMFSALNHPTWQWGANTGNPTAPNFGTVLKQNGQNNNPRQGQLGVKVIW
jgi:hypothetical protein